MKKSTLRLPHSIEDMIPGEIGYVVPWAVQSGRIRGNYIVHKRKSKLATQKIECTIKGQYYVVVEE